MRKRKIRLLPFTKKDSSTGTVSQNSPSNNDTLLSKYYHHINQLPLYKFIDVVIEDNIYALIISGKPTDIQLTEAWQNIKLQFADAIKDNESRLIASLEKELNRLRITYHQILECIKQLQRTYTKQFAAMLNKLLKYSFKLDVRFPDDYNNDLKRAFNRSKGIMLDIQMKEKAYENIRSRRQSPGQRPTREYYQGILITLSDFVRYPITEQITVFEFCDRIRRLNEYNDSLKHKPNGKRK